MPRLPLSDSIFKLPFGGDETGHAPSLQEYTQVIRHGGMIPRTRIHLARITMSIRLG